MGGLLSRIPARALALATLAVLGAACLGGGPEPPDGMDAARAPAEAGIKIAGEIEASDAVWVGQRALHWKFRGDVIEKIVPEGTRLKKGDFLFSVETRLWEREKEDVLELVKRREVELAGAQARLATAQGELEAARKKLPSRLEPYRLAIRRLQGLPDPVDLSAVQSELELRLAQLAEAKEQVKAVEAMVEAQAEGRQALPEARLASEIAAADVALAGALLSEVEQGADPYEIEIAEAELAMAQVDAELEVVQQSLAVAGKGLEVRWAESRLSWARKDIEIWENAIANAARPAPADGIVAYEKTYVGSGQFEKVGPGVEVSWGRRICSIISGKAFRFRGRASEAVLGRIRPGQEARVSLAALPDQVLTGRVTSLDVASGDDEREPPTISELERPRPKEFEVLIDIDQPPEGLMPGLGGEATISCGEAPAEQAGRRAPAASPEIGGAGPRFAGYVEPVQSTAVLTHNSVAGTIIRLAPQYGWLEEGDVILETTGHHAQAYVTRAEDAPKFARAELEQLRLRLDAEKSRWLAEIKKAELARKVAELRFAQLRAQPGPFAIEAAEARVRRARLEHRRARQRLELARAAGLDSLRDLQAKELEAALAERRVQEASTRLSQAKKGPPVARIREAELGLEEAEAQLVFARAMADEMGPVAEAELAATEATVLDAEEELLHYKKQYEHRIVRAPVAGNIIYNPHLLWLRKRLGMGDDMPSAVQCIGYVADLSRLKSCAIAEEPYVGQVRVGAKARIELLAFPGRSFDGKVLSVVPVIMDREEILETRVDARRLSGVRAARVDVLFELPPGEGLRVLPGMTGTVALLPAGQRGG